MADYTFGSSSFKHELWINNGAHFTNVKFVEIDVTNSCSFRLEVVADDGQVISSCSENLPHGGWATPDFSIGGPMRPPMNDGTYRLRLVNTSAHDCLVRAGTVHTT